MATADLLIRALEASDHHANVCRVDRGQWLLPLVRVCTAAAVILARKVERANR